MKLAELTNMDAISVNTWKVRTLTCSISEIAMESQTGIHARGSIALRLSRTTRSDDWNELPQASLGTSTRWVEFGSSVVCCCGRIKKLPCCKQQGSFKNPAIPTFTLVCTIIGSESLTSVFGMGTGRTFTIWSPERPSSGYFAAERPCCLVVFILKEFYSQYVRLSHEFRGL